MLDPDFLGIDLKFDQFLLDQFLDGVTAMHQLGLDRLAQPAIWREHADVPAPIHVFDPEPGRIRGLPCNAVEARHSCGVLHIGEVIAFAYEPCNLLDFLIGLAVGLHPESPIWQPHIIALQGCLAAAGRMVWTMSEPRPIQAGTGTREAPWTSRRLVDWIRGHLESKEVDSPRVCAELLVASVLGCEQMRLYMEPDRQASRQELDTLRDLVTRAGRHEPVQYLVGSWKFHGRDFKVSPCTLIPRPSTETLVERALQEIRDRGVAEPWRILDLCTGTGCLAVSLAVSMRALRSGRISDRFMQDAGEETEPDSDGDDATGRDIPVLDLDLNPVRDQDAEQVEEHPSPRQASSHGSLSIIASDIVAEALELAAENALLHDVGREIECREGNLFEVLSEDEKESFHLICSNPPYVSDEEYARLDRNVRDYEPAIALRGGPRGLDVVGPIIEESPKWLCEGGLLLVEIADATRLSVMKLLDETDRLELLEILADHEGYQRVLVARRL